MSLEEDSAAYGYAWLASGDRPGAWMSEASCFTFVEGLDPQGVVAADELGNVRELDLHGVADAAETFFAGDADPDTAVFDSGRGW